MFGNSTPVDNNTEITDVRILAKEFMMYKIGMLHYTSLVERIRIKAYIHLRGGIAFTPDWSTNSFVMLACKKFLIVQSEFSIQNTTKPILIDNHYKTI